MRKLSLFYVLLLLVIIAGCNRNEMFEQEPIKPVIPSVQPSIIITGDSVIATRSTSDGRVDFTGGYATGAGLYDGEATATVQAVPNAGYRLASFTGGPVEGNPNQFSGASNYVFPIERQDWRFSVSFKKEYQISVTAGTGGYVTGGGTVLEGDNCTVVAYPKTGYTFDGWYESGSKVSVNSSYTFAVSSNRTMT